MYAADWSPDGRELAIARFVAPGEERLEYPLGHVLFKSRVVRHPRVSPVGERVAFQHRGFVAVVDRAGKAAVLSPPLKRSLSGLAWSPKGDEIWFGAALRGDEWAIYAVDLGGRLRVVTELPSVGHVCDVLPDGRALVSMHYDRGETMVRAPGAAEERNVSWLDWTMGTDISADGRLLLSAEGGHGGARNWSYYLRPTDGSAPAVLVAEGGGQTGSVWLSPDGHWVLHIPGDKYPEPRRELRLVPTGAGETRSVRLQGVESVRPATRGEFVLPGNEEVVLCGREPGKPARSWVQSLIGGAPRAITPEGRCAEGVSPDGRLAVARDEQNQLLLYPLAGGQPRQAAGPPETGVIRTWSADGRTLFIVETMEDGISRRILRRDLASGRRDTWREFRPSDNTGLAYFNATVSADGRAYGYSYARCLSSLYLVEGLR